MLEKAKSAGVPILMLTVDSITGGNRERDLRTGFSIPLRLTLAGMIQFAIKPKWAIEHFTMKNFGCRNSTSTSTCAAARPPSAITSPRCSTRR